MKDKHLWVGYLNIADRKILVASDERVDAANKKTLYLYNQERDDIIEYKREVIQAKLKDAPASDYNADTMASAYQKALRKKFPNLHRVIFAANTRGSAVAKEKRPPVATDDDEIEVDESFEMADDDFEDEEEDFEDKD